MNNTLSLLFESIPICVRRVNTQSLPRYILENIYKNIFVKTSVRRRTDEETFLAPISCLVFKFDFNIIRQGKGWYPSSKCVLQLTESTVKRLMLNSTTSCSALCKIIYSVLFMLAFGFCTLYAVYVQVQYLFVPQHWNVRLFVLLYFHLCER